MRANFIPALIVCAASFILFRWLYLRVKSATGRLMLLLTALSLAIPAVLFASNYVLYIPYADWFYNLHALPGVEISSGFVGAFLGIMFASDKLRPNKLNGPVLIVCCILSFCLLMVPFLKQLYLAVDYSSLTNKWKDGVCLQTSNRTCVPACAATLVRMQGGKVTEAELAREAGTIDSGTEFWYLKRALRKRGYEAIYHSHRSLKSAPVPCILGVKMGYTGHVVVLLHKDKDGVIIGEPLTGRKQYDWRVFRECYKPSGDYYTIRKM